LDDIRTPTQLTTMADYPSACSIADELTVPTNGLDDSGEIALLKKELALLKHAVRIMFEPLESSCD